MRKDSRGNPDVCRETYTPVMEDARRIMNELKLDTNALMEKIRWLFENNPDHQVKRLLAMAISEYEVGALLVAKAITAEGFVSSGAKQDFDWPNK